MKIPRSNHLAINFLIQGVRFQISSWIQDLYPLHAVTSLSGYLGCQRWEEVAVVCYKQHRYSRISHFHYSASLQSTVHPSLPQITWAASSSPLAWHINFKQRSLKCSSCWVTFQSSWAACGPRLGQPSDKHRGLEGSSRDTPGGRSGQRRAGHVGGSYLHVF